jgi:hypothetical protein
MDRHLPDEFHIFFRVRDRWWSLFAVPKQHFMAVQVTQNRACWRINCGVDQSQVDRVIGWPSIGNAQPTVGSRQCSHCARCWHVCCYAETAVMLSRQVRRYTLSSGNTRGDLKCSGHKRVNKTKHVIIVDMQYCAFTSRQAQSDSRVLRISRYHCFSPILCKEQWSRHCHGMSGWHSNDRYQTFEATDGWWINLVILSIHAECRCRIYFGTGT